jgi:tetratricopeptide (TPR) repeat protein
MTLPYDVPDFTGRPGERQRLLTHHRASHGPAIHVIEGMAGVGKTALAVHAAHELAPHYPDGQVFVDLCGFTPDRTPTSPADLLDVLLRAIGVSGDHIPCTCDERVALWRTELTGRRILVVLDNAADAAQVTPLIPASAGSAVIITSRRRLTGLAGATPITLDVLPEQDATSLVRRLVGPDRADREPEALARLGELCGFLPLAIRIAAARLQRRPQWTIGRLVDRLGAEHRRLTELAVDTQHGVAAAFAQSYRAISVDQQRLFRLLGLHPGLDLDVPAAAAMADLMPDHVDDLLQQLVDEHLLQESVPGRFTYHDLLRAHARRLAEADDPEQVRHGALSRLFDHYRETTAHAVALLDPQDTLRRYAVPRRPARRPVLVATATTAREWLDREAVNLVTVATQPGWPAHSRDMSALLAAYLEQQARYSDAGAVHRAALAVATTNADKALAVRNLGRIHLYRGRLDQARQHFTEALELLDDHDDPLGVVTVMNDLAITHTEAGRYVEANSICVRALEICADTGDSVGRMRLLMTYGNSESHLGRYSDASIYLHQSLELAEELGHRDIESKAYLNIGELYTKTNRHDEAVACLRQARDLFGDCGNAQGEAMARANLGGLLTQLARHDEATDHLEPALAFFREAGNRRWEGAVLRQLGTLSNHVGRCREAVTYLENARTVAREIGMPSTEAEIANLLGDTCRKLGQPHRARDHYRAALTIANTAGQRHDEANAHRGLGHVHDELGDQAEAQRHWRRCVELYSELDLRVDEVRQLLTGAG